MTNIPNGERYGKSGVRISLSPPPASADSGNALFSVGGICPTSVCDNVKSPQNAGFWARLKRKASVITARLVYLKCRTAEFLDV